MFNVKKYGTQTLNDYLTYLSHYHQVKKSIFDAENSKEFILFPSVLLRWIKYLTMLEMGIGESDVLSHSLCYFLLQENLGQPISILAIENTQHQKHYLILLSHIIPEKNISLTDALAQLPHDAIIIDPFLKFVNNASYMQMNTRLISIHTNLEIFLVYEVFHPFLVKIKKR